MGACALIIAATPLAAGASPSDELARHVATMQKDTAVLTFFDRHAWLLTDPRFAEEAKRQVTLHTASLRKARKRAQAARDAMRKRRELARSAERKRKLQALRSLEPGVAICKVFGRYCGEALRVSRCESGLRTTAQNGQYRGLFQMGSSERRLFGHGATAIEQARAAHRYFVRSGSDWSPWSCKP